MFKMMMMMMMMLLKLSSVGMMGMGLVSGRSNRRLGTYVFPPLNYYWTSTRALMANSFSLPLFQVAFWQHPSLYQQPRIGPRPQLAIQTDLQKSLAQLSACKISLAHPYSSWGAQSLEGWALGKGKGEKVFRAEQTIAMEEGVEGDGA